MDAAPLASQCWDFSSREEIAVARRTCRIFAGGLLLAVSSPVNCWGLGSTTNGGPAPGLKNLQIWRGWRVSGQDEAGEQAPPNHMQVAQLFSTAASPSAPPCVPICVRGCKPDTSSAAGSDFTRGLLWPPGYGWGGTIKPLRREGKGTDTIYYSKAESGNRLRRH